MQESVHTPESKCPRCGYALDGAAGVQDERQPKPGDYSLCLECGGLLVFDETLHLRMPTPEEEAAAPLEVARVQLAIRDVHKTKAWKERER